jgi:DNA-binding MarR family transcriptional regulator
VDVDNAPNRLRSLPSWLLGQAAIEARRAVSEVLAREGVHRSQYALMASLEEFGPLSQTALSDRSGLDRSDVVRWVDGLAARGLVQRTRDPGDRRRNVISITRQGVVRLEELDADIGRAQQDLLSGLSDEERRLLILLLRRLLGLQRPPS